MAAGMRVGIGSWALANLAALALAGCEGEQGTPSRDGGGSEASTPDGGDGTDASGPDSGLQDAGGPDGGHDPDAGRVGSGPDPDCQQNGCLRSLTHHGDFSRGQIAPLLEPGVSIDNGYSVYTMRYVTGGRQAAATVTVPYQAEAPDGGWAIVGNNHGTSGIEDPCALTHSVYGTGLAALFGARGTIGVAPDYPGLGTDGLHGYLVSRQEGRAALDALRATRSFARFQELPISDEYAMVGLSQGGHATLAAAAAHEQYAPELDIRAFAAAAPASGWSEHWRQGVNVQGSHQAYHALLVYSWAQHYGWSGPALWDSGFAADVEDVMTNHCIFDPASGSNTLAPEVSNDPAQVFSEAFFEAYSSGDWGEFAQFGNWFAENRIGPYGQTAPLRIYQGSDDPVVLEDHTRQMVQALRDGGVEVDYKVVSGGRHTDVAFGFVAQDQRRTEESIAWVQSHL